MSVDEIAKLPKNKIPELTNDQLSQIPYLEQVYKNIRLKYKKVKGKIEDETTKEATQERITETLNQ
ncbi:MAG: hypothetical protein U9Q83_04805 [Bacteroidota bacterium]|nr:hypothetical protein [Bacteroidota bacterium]